MSRATLAVGITPDSGVLLRCAFVLVHPAFVLHRGFAYLFAFTALVGTHGSGRIHQIEPSRALYAVDLIIRVHVFVGAALRAVAHPLSPAFARAAYTSCTHGGVPLILRVTVRVRSARLARKSCR